MPNNQLAEDRFTNAILQAIESEVTKVIEEETEEACKRVRQRMSDSLARLTLGIMSKYDVRRMEDHLVISVRNDALLGS